MWQTSRLKPLGSEGLLRVGVFAACGLALGMFSAHDPETVYGTVMAALWIVIVLVLLYRGGSGPSRSAIWIGIGFRVVMAFAYLGIVAWFLRGSADSYFYNQVATAVGEGLLRGEAPSESNVRPGLSILFGLLYFMVGPSLLGMFVVSALLGFLGAYLIYRAFEIAVPEGKGSRKFLLIMLFGLPSFALWTSVLGKESWMLFCIGLTMYSFASLLKAQRPRHYVGLLAGIGGAVVVRPPIGTILLFSVLCSLLFRRGQSTTPVALLRPVALGVTGLVAVTLLWQLTFVSIADRWGSAGAGLVEERAVFAALAEYHRGLALDTPSTGAGLGVQIAEPTATAVLGYLPQGMFALFFRPFIFEAHNAVAAAAALESTLLLVLFIARIRHLATAARIAVREPFIASCWIAGLLLSMVLAMGPNFGVMIRQRGMVLPFLFILLSILPKRFVGHSATDSGAHVSLDAR